MSGKSAGSSRRIAIAAVVMLWVLGGLTGCLNNVGHQSLYGNGGDGGNCASGNCGTSCGNGSCGLATCSMCRPKLLGMGLLHGKSCGKGCGHGQGYQPPNPQPPHQTCPTEIQMVSLPPHKIAPPDILSINVIRMIPRPPYRLEALEQLLVFVPETDTLPKQPIAGPYTISLDGRLNLGFGYGSVYIGGMTPDEAQTAIRRHLSNILKNNPQVNVSLAQFRGMENIRGEHLVRPDGTISLGSYGSVYVAGLALGQAKCVIEEHLSRYLVNPQISIDVFAYNSRMYYVIIDGGGFGQQVFRLPHTGNETVMDAISQVQGLAPVSSLRRIHLARPSPCHLGCNQILPVDWQAITQGGSTCTNYQIFPGDRIYVGANCLIAADNKLSQVLAPVERVLGIMLLGTNVFQSISGNNNGNNAVFIP